METLCFTLTLRCDVQGDVTSSQLFITHFFFFFTFIWQKLCKMWLLVIGGTLACTGLINKLFVFSYLCFSLKDVLLF